MTERAISEVAGRNRTAHLVGGSALILAAILFIAEFSYLAGAFDYPDILDRSAGEVLPALIALGSAGRFVWILYAITPLLLIPAAVGAEERLRHVAPATVRVATGFAIVAAISMVLGLIRWPSIHWEFARRWATAGVSERASIETVFAGLNSYLGNFIGEFLGELCLSLFFVLLGFAMMREGGRRRWLGATGVAVGVIGLVAMLRNATRVVAPIAEANNLVLPLWLVVLGVAIGWGHRRSPGR